MSTDPKPIPLGAPLPLSDADLDELSRITSEDVRRARELWRKAAPPEFETLLEPILIDLEDEG